MSENNTSTRIKPVKDFTDAGTERQFKKGRSVTVPRGVAENYAAAGLIEPLPAIEEPDDATPEDETLDPAAQAA